MRRLYAAALALALLWIPTPAHAASVPPTATSAPPTATTVPTATPVPPSQTPVVIVQTAVSVPTQRPRVAPVLSINPSQVIQNSPTDGVAIAGHGFDKGTVIHLSFIDPGGATHPLRDVTTSGAGTFTYLLLASTFGAGTYTFTAEEGPDPTIRDSATLQVQPLIGAAPGGAPGDLNTPWGPIHTGDWWRAITMGLLTWWSGFYSGGANKIIDPIVSVALYIPPIASGAFSFIAGSDLIQYGSIALQALLVVRMVALIVGVVRNHRNVEAAVLSFVLLSILVASVYNLSDLEASGWAWINDYSQAIAGMGLDHFKHALETWTTIKPSDMASLGTFLLDVLGAGFLVLVCVVLFVIMVLTNVGGLLMLIVLFILGPLLLPLLVTEFTRPVGGWWAKSIVAISLWHPVYAHIIQAGGGVVDTLGADHSLFGSPFMRVALGVGLVIAFNMVPALCGGAVALVRWGGAGAVDAAKLPFAKQSDTVGDTAKGFIPIVGKSL